jgi:putative hemolysin
MADPWFNILVILVCILLSGFFAAAEIALVSVRRSRIQELAEQGNRNAALVQGLLKNPERFFAVLQIGITLLISGASVLGGVVAVQFLKPFLLSFHLADQTAESISVTVTVLCVSYVTLVLGELAPKSLGLAHAERVALTAARIVTWLLRIGNWLIRFVTASTNLVLRPFGDRTSFLESRISQEEFKLLLEEGTKSGVIEKSEQELIESIFEFTDMTAKDVMVPRTDMVGVELHSSREKLIRTVIEQGYTRMPVYEDDLDHIAGEVYAKDLLALMEHGDLIVVRDLIRPAYFVPETKLISELMREFQYNKLHLAIIVDEFGGTAGLVTLEDILEEIVGEIHDEYDEPGRMIEEQSDGSYLVSAMLPVDDVNERCGTILPEDEAYETLAGYVTTLFGRIPEIGDEKTGDGVRVTITKRSRKRIDQVRISKLPHVTTVPS